jgi:hypothetical protein
MSRHFSVHCRVEVALFSGTVDDLKVHVDSTGTPLHG